MYNQLVNEPMNVWINKPEKLAYSPVSEVDAAILVFSSVQEISWHAYSIGYASQPSEVANTSFDVTRKMQEYNTKYNEDTVPTLT